MALVTVLMESSTGENRVLARRSQRTQNRAPHKKDAGIIRIGFDVFSNCREICGTAMPTKETGPAKAATQDESMPVIRTSSIRNAFIFTPRLLAYPSPIR